MCYLLWIFSQSDRCILSQYVAIFYPNQSSVSCQIPSHEFTSISSLGVTCFSTLKNLIRISGRDSVKGGRVWHPQVSISHYIGRFIPISNAQWKFLFLARVCLWLSRLFIYVSLISEFLSLTEGQIWSLLKLLFSARMRTRKSFSNYKSHLKLIKSNSRRLLSDLSPNPIPRTSIDVRLF